MKPKIHKPFDVTTTPLTPGTCALIEANAGTGKTFNIQHLYLRLLIENQLEPSRILVVTFTEAATAELRDRIRKNLASALTYLDAHKNEADSALSVIIDKACCQSSVEKVRNMLRLALASFDEAAIFTIHGFCKRTLDRNAFESKIAFDCELCQSHDSLMREVVADFYRLEQNPTQAPVVQFDNLLNHAQTILQHIGKLEIEPDVILDQATAWKELLQVIQTTPLPPKSSKFKTALISLQDALTKNSLSDDTPALKNASLCDDTANRNAPDLVKALTQYQDLAKNSTYARLRAFIAHPQYGFEARKCRQQTMGYNDLLRNMNSALDGPDCLLACELRKNYSAVFVDEFQDTDPVQYRIFETVFKHKDTMFFMIGDPKQAIYKFRGGDIFAYLQAKRGIAEQSRFTLSKNFRSVPQLIAAINALFSPDNVFAEPELTYTPSSCGTKLKRTLLKNRSEDCQPFELTWLTGDAQGQAIAKSHIATKITRDCATQITELLNGSEFIFKNEDQTEAVVTPGDIAVLVTKNREAEALQKQLQKHRIPAVIYRAGNVFKTRDAVSLWHVLSAMTTPNQPGRIKAALLTSWCAYTPSEIIALEQNPDSFTQQTEAFVGFYQLWLNKGVMVALTAFLDHFKSFTKLAQDPTCERRLTNFRQLAELLHQAEDASELQPDTLLNWLQHQIKESDDNNEAYEQRLESDCQAITIMTIHKSKGLEFPIVFVPYLITQDINPIRNRSYIVHKTLADGTKQAVFPITATAQDDLKAQLMQETLAEHLRMLYVAVTRATHRCSVLMGNIHGQGAKSAVNYLVQMHAHPEPPTTPQAFIATTPAPGNAAPFEAIKSIVTRKVSAAELGSQMPTGYSPREKAVELASPPPPPQRTYDWAVMSYSGMSQHEHFAPILMKPDAGADEITDTTPPMALNDDLPGGQATGLCLHAILQQLDFPQVTAEWQADQHARALIDKHARFFGLYTPTANNAEIRRARIQNMIATTLTRLLPSQAGTFSLSEIANQDTQREWEFFFETPRHVVLEEFTRLGLTFKNANNTNYGFMTGSIDLLFRRNDRYFFADWKTDTLGVPEAYAPAQLQNAMTQRNYQFQAIIYAVALHNLLRQTLGHQYDFERHFGGGYYFFVRGITANAGVYTFQPELTTLENWDRLLRKGTA